MAQPADRGFHRRRFAEVDRRDPFPALRFIGGGPAESGQRVGVVVESDHCRGFGKGASVRGPGCQHLMMEVDGFDSHHSLFFLPYLARGRKRQKFEPLPGAVSN